MHCKGMYRSDASHRRQTVVIRYLKLYHWPRGLLLAFILHRNCQSYTYTALICSPQPK